MLQPWQNVATLDSAYRNLRSRMFDAFSPDGKTLLSKRIRMSSASELLVELWDLQTQTLITTFEITSAINDVSTAYSPDGTMMLKHFQGTFSLLEFDNINTDCYF